MQIIISIELIAVSHSYVSYTYYRREQKQPYQKWL